MSKRIPYYDFLRGLSIIMVVAIHTTTSSNSTISIILRQLFNCAVPIFLAISGFFLNNNDVSNKKGYLQFIKKQVPKVYVPCLFWSFPLVLKDLYNNSFGFNEIILFFLCGYSIYYFIALIIQFYLLLPLLQKLKGVVGIVIGASISFVSILIVTYLLRIKGLNLPLVIFAGPFFLWIIFFMEGLYLGHLKKRNNSVFPILIITIITLYLSIAEFRYWNAINDGGIGIKLSSFVFSAFAIILLFSQKVEIFFSKFGKLYDLIVEIGKMSFGIYLTHCYIVILINKFLYSSLTSIWFIRWLIVIVISTITVWQGRKYLPKKFNQLIGF